MSVTFLTPVAALVAAVVLLPLAELVARSRRASLLRKTLGLPRGTRRRLAVPVVALVGIAALLGLAAAQPVLQRTVPERVRTDAEAYVVLDVSRSMLARGSPAGATRLARAKAAATELRAALADVPVGIASLTDRVLPHVFPTADEDVFHATLSASLGIERPPPRLMFASRATRLDALADVARRSFFSPAARRRLLVVLTDGESDPVVSTRIARIFAGPPSILPVFVHVWSADERVYSRGVAEPQYRPDPAARTVLDALALATGGAVFAEDEFEAAAEQSRALVGSGPTRAEGVRTSRTPLAQYLAAAAFLPLVVLLVRRER